MTYYIINENKIVDGEFTSRPFGYVTDYTKLDEFAISSQPYLNWIASNLAGLENATISINDYFNTVSKVYISTSHTDVINGWNIEEITDFSFLTGGE